MALPLNARLYKLFKLDTTADSFYIAEKFRNASMREEHKHAYHTLAHPERKRLYDIGGEPSADLLQGQMWGPLVSGLGCTWTARLYGFCTVSLAVLLILFFSFLAAKVDGSLAWTWAQVTVPLLILVLGAFILSLLVFACAIRFPHRHDDHIFAAFTIETLGVFFCGVCYFIFIILVVYNLMTNWFGYAWMKSFCLPIMGDVVYLLSRMVSKYPRRMRRVLLSSPQRSEAPWYVVYGFTALIVIFIILAIIRSVLIGTKLDHTTKITWFRVFAPIAVRFFFEFVYAALSAVTLVIMDMKSVSHAVFNILAAFVSNSCIVISVFLVAAKLEGVDIKLGHALLPIYLLLACFFIGSLFTAVYILMRDRELREVENAARARASELSAVVATGEPGPRYSAGVRDHGIRETEEDELEDVESDYGHRAAAGGDERHHPFAEWPALGGDGSIDEEMEEVEVDEEEEHFTSDGHSPFEGPDGYHAEHAVDDEPSLSPQQPLEFPPRHGEAPPPMLRSQRYAVDSSDDEGQRFYQPQPRRAAQQGVTAPPQPHGHFPEEDDFEEEEFDEEEEADEEYYEGEEEEGEEEEEAEEEMGQRQLRSQQGAPVTR